MFNLSSSSSDSEGFFKKRDKMKTKTITVVYSEVPRLEDVVLESEDFLFESNDESTLSSSSLATPTTIDSTQTVMNRLDQEKEKGKFFGYYPTWREMSLSDGIKVTTLDYFCNCKIFQLFNFLMTHLLAETPEDPVPFLLSLIERCIHYRDEGGDPPLVFKDDHIRSIYVSMDPLVEGSISYSQYLVGMQTLGLTEFNIIPNEMDICQNVPKDVFVKEAKQALLNQLDLILGKGRDTSSVSGERFQNVVEYENIPTAREDNTSKDNKGRRTAPRD